MKHDEKEDNVPEASEKYFLRKDIFCFEWCQGVWYDECWELIHDFRDKSLVTFAKVGSKESIFKVRLRWKM